MVPEADASKGERVVDRFREPREGRNRPAGRPGRPGLGRIAEAVTSETELKRESTKRLLKKDIGASVSGFSPPIVRVCVTCKPTLFAPISLTNLFNFFVIYPVHFNSLTLQLSANRKHAPRLELLQDGEPAGAPVVSENGDKKVL